MLWCPIYTVINPLNPEFEPVLVVSTGTRGRTSEDPCMFNAAGFSHRTKSPVLVFISPLWWSKWSMEDRGGQVGEPCFLPNCIRFVRKRHWPSRPWNDLLIPRGDTSICRDAVDTFWCQTRRCSINPLCQSLMGADKKYWIGQKTSQMTARSTIGIWQTRDYLETGTRGPTEPDFTGLTLRFTACSALMTAN